MFLNSFCDLEQRGVRDIAPGIPFLNGLVQNETKWEPKHYDKPYIFPLCALNFVLSVRSQEWVESDCH